MQKVFRQFSEHVGVFTAPILSQFCRSEIEVKKMAKSCKRLSAQFSAFVDLLLTYLPLIN